MSEPPGAQPALGIDSVEWLAMADNILTVVVKGRWRRRASWRGRPVLVVEVHGRRHRFRAIPDPPSIAGATPGTWQMSFSVSADLAPYLGEHAWLQVGAVVVPLPGVVGAAARPPEAAGDSGPEAGGEAGSEPGDWPEPSAAFEPTIGAEPPEPASETEQPEPRAAEAGPGRVGEEHTRRAESVIAAAAELSERIRQLERERRAAEQRAHEEHARRLKLEEQQASIYPQVATAQDRIRDLERQLAEARGSPWRPDLGAEIAVASAARAAPAHGRAAEVAGAELARAQLDRERAMIARAESNRAAELERELRDHMIRAERLYDVIEELRAVLDGIRGVEDAEPEGDPDVAERAAVEPDRLDAALTRLRETIPPQVPEEMFSGPEPAPEPLAQPATISEPAATSEPAASSGPAAPTRKSSLLRALRTLTREEPALAGRIVLGLLPAVRLGYADPVSFDLVLADAGCIQVTARGIPADVTPAPAPRAWKEVDFRLTGELETFARLLVAGRLRRRFGRRMAHVEGTRKALSALTSLVRTPLGLGELYAAGARLDPLLALRLVSVMIDPKAAASHRFTIAHRGPSGSCYLKVSGRERPVVSDLPPLGPVATTIVCEPAVLLGVLGGEDPPGVLVRGATEPLALLRDWVLRAKSG